MTTSVADRGRLDALRRYQILDTEREPAFDRITKLAARIFKVPIALAGFIDEDRHWFKSCYGVDLRQVEHRVSFCVHALDVERVLVIPDATKDERFADNPLVTGDAHIRFYAGAPVRSADGHSLGTLCIMDTTPREPLDDDQITTLTDLATMVASELELRLTTTRALEAEAARAESEAHYRSLIQNASDIITLVDAEGTIRFQSPAFEAILGHDPDTAVGSSILDWLHPADAAAFQRDFAAALTAGEHVSCVYRAATATGEWRWLESAIANALDDPSIHAMVMHSRDVTQRERIAAELHASSTRVGNILQSISDAFVLLDDQWRAIDANEQAAALLRLEEGTILGSSLEELLPAGAAERFRAETRKALLDREPATFELHDPGADVWFEVRAYPGAEGLAVYVRDISDRKTAQEQIVRSKEDAEQANAQLAATVRELEERTVELDLLSEMGEVLQACQSSEEAFIVCEEYLDLLFTDKTGAVCLTSASGDLLETVAEWGGFSATPESRVFAPDRCWALRRGRTHVVDAEHSRLRCWHVGQEFDGQYVCVPLMAQGQALGILHMRRTQPVAATFSASKKRLATAVAEQIALAINNIELRVKLRNQSIRDPLTGLYNRRYLEESFSRELHRAARSEQPLTLIMLDADHFKSFNDTFGHEAGDLVLREIAALMRRSTRMDDIACRYGGEEFLIVLPGATLADAERRAEGLREQAKKLTLEYRGQPLATITLSLGVAGYPDHGASVEALIRAADAALYRAKAAGRDRVVVADGEQAQG